jgi:hypothetical protein
MSLAESYYFLGNIGNSSSQDEIAGFPSLLIAGLTILFAILLLNSLIHCCLHIGRNRLSALLPLGLNLLNLVLFISLHEFVVQPDFYFHQPAREAVVEMIIAEAKAIAPVRTRQTQMYGNSDQPNHTIQTVALLSDKIHLSVGFNVGNPQFRLNPGEIEIVRTSEGKLQAVFFFRSNSFTRVGPGYTAFVYKPDNQKPSYEDIWGVANLSFYLGINDTKKMKDHWYWIDVDED